MTPRWTTEKFAVAPLKIVDGDRGKNYPKHPDFHDTGHCLFLNTGNVTQHGFNFDQCQFITEDKDDALRKGKLLRGDVVLTTRGTVGNVAHYGDAIPFKRVRINSGMVIFRTQNDKLLPRFLYHYLRSNIFKRQVNSLRTGAAQPQLPIRDIKAIGIPVPTISTQHRIADILSAYDDLIENNRRRITLLDRAAREVYREWFVRLRLPGHEHTKIVNGVPEGWERTELGSIGQLKYGKALKAEYRIEGEFPVYGSSGVIGTHDEAHVQGPGIIVGRKGNVGSVYWSDESFCAIDTVYFFEPSASTLYIYYALQNVNFINTDVAVPGLNRNFAHSRKVLMPNDQVRDAFDDVAVPIHKQISLLRKENESLMRARDLLLPRLMSGELAV